MEACAYISAQHSTEGRSFAPEKGGGRTVKVRINGWSCWLKALLLCLLLFDRWRARVANAILDCSQN